MSLKVTAIKGIHDHEYSNGILFPFSNVKIINSLVLALKIEGFTLYLYNDDRLNLVLYLFRVPASNNSWHWFNGGRFGRIFPISISGNLTIAVYLEDIKRALLQYGSCSICIFDSLKLNNFHDFQSTQIYSNWIVNNNYYNIALTYSLVNEYGLTFNNALKRTGFSRILKKAHEIGYNCSITKEYSDLNYWYNYCHTTRMKEINGKCWSINFLKTLFDNPKVLLVKVSDHHNVIVGGCIILESESVLELFMMSTPSRFLKDGVNYILSEFIYKYSFKHGRKFINWQASNPPDGNVAEFKKKWMAQLYEYKSYSWTNIPLSFNYFNTNFPECYIYPYDLTS